MMIGPSATDPAAEIAAAIPATVATAAAAGARSSHFQAQRWRESCTTAGCRLVFQGDFIVHLIKEARQRAAGALLSLLLGAALVPAAPAIAHHAFAAEYDSSVPLDLSGVVTKAKWVNPHSWLFFDVKGADGNVTNWGVELGAPNSLALKGLQKADLKPGAEVHVKGYRSKSGGAYGYAVTLTLADGRSFQTGGAQDAPATGSQTGQQ